MRLPAGTLLLGLAGALQACAVAPLAPPAPITELAGTTWRVVAINSRPTPAAGDYSMRFDASDGLGAHFGCNSMGGRYSLTGDRLVVGDLASTLMGCPEPAATFEGEGAAVLAQPMRIAFTSNDRMFLTSSAGSIALDPVP